MKGTIRKLVSLVVSDYRINWIYACNSAATLPMTAGDEICEIDHALYDQLAASKTAKVANSLSYARAGLEGLAILRDGQPLCVAHFAGPEQYDREATWPLREGEVALMDIATEEAARGQGLAPRMITAASRHFLSKNTKRLIAFIWWSNTPSIRAFRKAQWRRIGLSLEWKMGQSWHKIQVKL